MIFQQIELQDLWKKSRSTATEIWTANTATPFHSGFDSSGLITVFYSVAFLPQVTIAELTWFKSVDEIADR